jgi:acyl-CoA dehydrogenase
MGEKNLIANLYLASPIGITVEGANVLTRSLLQFGQGVIRCHPYILNEIRAIKENNIHEFDKNLWNHAYSFASNCVRTLFLGLTSGRISRPFHNNVVQKYNAKLNYISARFATLTDYAMIKYGGALKRKEFLSSRFADITSHMFLISSVLKKFASGNFSECDRSTVEYICDLYLYKIQESFYDINTNISRGNIISAVLNIFGAFSRKILVKKKTSWKNIESIVNNYINNRTIAIEEVFIPNNPDEQMHKMVSAFSQSEIINVIEKRMRKFGCKTPEDALKSKVINQNEFEEITIYNTLCNEIIQVDNFELRSLVNEN